MVDDRVRLAFGASVLTQVQGLETQTGRIIRRTQFRSTRLSLPTLAAPVRDAINQVQAIREAIMPPPLVLNRHCQECARALAVYIDGMGSKNAQQRDRSSKAVHA